MTRILIADDNEAFLELVSFNLRQEGHAVLMANDGHDVLHRVRLVWPDLILLNLGLSGLGGPAVYEILRQRSGTMAIPIIFLTAWAGEESQPALGQLGVDDYLTDYLSKPFSPRELVFRVGRLLRRASDAAKILGVRIGPLPAQGLVI